MNSVAIVTGASQGIGRAMMAHALEECRKAGCYKLALSSNVQRANAHRFYESLGFTASHEGLKLPL